VFRRGERACHLGLAMEEALPLDDISKLTAANDGVKNAE
jgi:hypothetical protein